MHTKNIYRDGQTIDSYVAPVEGLHQGLTFKRRPMLAEEVEETESQIAKATPRQAVEIVVLTVTAKLVEWSEVTDDGKAAAITAGNVARLPYQLLNRVYRIVAGLTAGDLNRNTANGTTSTEADDFLKRLRDSGNGEGSPGTVDAKAQEGN